MIRKSYKYAFYFNVIIIFAALVIATVLNQGKTNNKTLPASVTTALLTVECRTENLAPTAKAAVLIDAKSGAALYEKNSADRLPMASTTKIMTALAVIENANLYDVITVTKDSVNIEGTKIYLSEGEKITVKDLLYGLLLESGNDAATALAIGVFGSEKGCCEVMNEISRSIGLLDTNFENPHGLDSDNHYTTAYELALITQRAMKNKTFKEIVSTESYVTTGETKRYFSNHNRLLRKSDMYTGVKTGYTSKAGRCLVSSTSVGNEEYIAVTLASKNDWQEHKDMHLFAEKNFDSVEIAKKDDFKIIAHGRAYYPKEDIYLTTSGVDNFKLNYKITLDKAAGRVQYWDDNAPLGSFSVAIKE